MMNVPARVLPTPTVCYNTSAKNSTCVPRDGVWVKSGRLFQPSEYAFSKSPMLTFQNMVGKKVFKGASLQSWGVVSFCADRLCPGPQVSAFVRELAVTCQDTGMDIVVSVSIYGTRGWWYASKTSSSSRKNNLRSSSVVIKATLNSIYANFTPPSATSSKNVRNSLFVYCQTPAFRSMRRLRESVIQC